MNKEKLKMYMDLTGILLCIVTIIVLIDYRGLSFFQGFLLKTTLTMCSGILFIDLVQLDIVKKFLEKVKKKLIEWKFLTPVNKQD